MIFPYKDNDNDDNDDVDNNNGDNVTKNISRHLMV